MCRITFLLFLVLLVCGSAGWSDEVVFKSGDRLTGKLVKIEKGKLVFEADEMGSVILDMGRIRNFSSDEPVELHFADGTVIKSKIVAAEPGRFSTEKTELLTAQAFGLDDLVAVNPPPKPEPKWTGSLTISLSSTHGNTFAESAHVSLDATRRSEKSRTNVYSNYLASRSRDDDEDKKKTTEESFLIGGKYDYFFSKQFYSYVSGNFKKDHVADLDRRIIAGAGVGYQWIEADDMKFSTDAGFAELCEQYTSRDDDTGEKVTTKTDEPSLRLGYNLDWKITDKFTFLHKLAYYPSFGSLADYFLTTDAELRASITKSMFGSFKVILDYDSTPADDVRTTDVKYLLGVGWNF